MLSAYSRNFLTRNSTSFKPWGEGSTPHINIFLSIKLDVVLSLNGEVLGVYSLLFSYWTDHFIP
ncbi:hypothetical protein SFRURICE_011602 [Spodoptera frugiperda]|nr:hypothetical protein SFRURICE_011602 [Spodoptera frugiperda]